VDLDRTGDRTARFLLGWVLVSEHKYTAETLQLLSGASDTIPLAHLLAGRVFLSEGEYARAKTELEMYLSTNEAPFRDIANEWLSAVVQLQSPRGQTITGFWLLHLIGDDVSLFSAREPAYFRPDADLRLEREQAGATHELWLSGRIDSESAPELRTLLLQRLRLTACRALIVNAEDVVYIDAAGIATLLEVLKAARLNGKQFVLKGLQERPRYLFETARLLHLFSGEDESACHS
jgi:anti-sigma B factor antagonist